MSAQPDLPFDGSPAEVELFTIAGHDGYLRGVNDSFAQLLGLSPAEVNDRSLLELVHPEDVGAIVAGLSALAAGAPEVLLENRFMRRDDRPVYLQWVARPISGTELWWAAGRDTTALHRLIAERTDLRARLDLAMGQATAAMWELDVRRGLLEWEPQAAVLLGISAESLPATPVALAAHVHEEDSAALLTALQQLLDNGMTEVGVRVGDPTLGRHLSLRGKVLDRDHRGRPVRAVGLLIDVSAEKAMEEQMLRMIMSDPLTGVPNRRAFEQTLRSESRRCARSLEPLSVVMIDIDNFKNCNDSFGHLVGDDVLCAVARALNAALRREGDSLARFGGEEFTVVLPNTAVAGALTVGNELVNAVRAVTMRQAPDWPITVSVGTATWLPEAAKLKPAELLARADQALYAAKRAGKNRALAFENTSLTEPILAAINDA